MRGGRGPPSASASLVSALGSLKLLMLKTVVELRVKAGGRVEEGWGG